MSGTKWMQQITRCFAVIPPEAGIQMYLNFLDSGSRNPGLDPGLPGMTMLFFVVYFGFRTLWPIEKFGRITGQ
jgi:hypothetical protein